MADIISNDSDKKGKNKLLIGGGVVGGIILIAAFMILSGGSEETAPILNDNTGSQLTNQNENYDGSTKVVDQEVKEEKNRKNKENQRKS